MANRASIVLILIAAGCAPRATGPTVTGAALYAKVAALRTEGRALIEAGPGKRPVEVRRGQYLVPDDRSQLFEVSQVIESCHGGDPEADVDCTLVLLRDRRFLVRDTPPPPPDTDDPKYLSTSAKLLLVGVAAAIPLAVGIKVCEFDGCESVLGLLLGVDALFILIVLVGFR